MTFSFYGYLDQQWIDSKIQEYTIYSGDVIELVEELCFDAKSILDSPNSLIYALLDCIARQLFECDEVQELSDDIKEQFCNKVYETFFINCIDSHMDPLYIVETMKDDIIKDITESFPELSTQEIDEKYTRLLDICQQYSF